MPVVKLPRVMHIEAGKNLYGGAQQVVYLLSGLLNYQVENILVCPTGSEIARAAQGLAIVVPIKMSGDIDIGLPRRLQTVIAQYQPNIIHVHSRRGADLFGAMAARKTGIAAICSRRVDNRENALFARWKYGHYQKVVCISEGIANVVKKTGLPSDRVQTIHSGVNLEQFQPIANRRWLNDEFGLNDDDIVIANFAQMIERKGQALLIKVFARLQQRHPNTRLLLFGKGPRLKQYEQLVCDLGLQSKVQFPGFRTDLPQIIPAVDIVAHPAFTEGLGVALLQSAACARPIVATAAGGIPEIVRHQQNGLLVNVGDDVAFHESLEMLVVNPELREKYGNSGRTIVGQAFSIKAMAESYYECYLKLIR